jgi:hypothetical protein
MYVTCALSIGVFLEGRGCTRAVGLGPSGWYRHADEIFCLQQNEGHFGDTIEQIADAASRSVDMQPNVILIK